jgi:hypothetical protein
VAGRLRGRPDVFSPGTGPRDGAIRDKQGRITGVTRLIQAPDPTDTDTDTDTDEGTVTVPTIDALKLITRSLGIGLNDACQYLASIGCLKWEDGRWTTVREIEDTVLYEALRDEGADI